MTQHATETDRNCINC